MQAHHRSTGTLFLNVTIALSVGTAPMSAARASEADPLGSESATVGTLAAETEPPGAQTPEGPTDSAGRGQAPAPADESRPPRTRRGMLITGAVFTGLGTLNGILCAADVGGVVSCGAAVLQLGVGLGLMLGGNKRAKRYAEWKAAHPHALSVAPLLPNTRTGAPGGLHLSLRF